MGVPFGVLFPVPFGGTLGGAKMPLNYHPGCDFRTQSAILWRKHRGEEAEPSAASDLIHKLCCLDHNITAGILQRVLQRLILFLELVLILLLLAWHTTYFLLILDTLLNITIIDTAAWASL